MQCVVVKHCNVKFDCLEHLGDLNLDLKVMFFQFKSEIPNKLI